MLIAFSQQKIMFNSKLLLNIDSRRYWYYYWLYFKENYEDEQLRSITVKKSEQCSNLQIAFLCCCFLYRKTLDYIIVCNHRRFVSQQLMYSMLNIVK